MNRLMKNCKSWAWYFATELLRFVACMATVLLWFFLMLMLVPESPAAPIALTTRDCGPMSARPTAAAPGRLGLRREIPRTPHPAPRDARLARITVYAPDEPRSDHWTRRRRSATGVRLAWGHCAVDPRRIPYGSTVIVGRHRFVAVDCGAFRGWHIDVFFDRWRDALRYDRATPDRMPITVIRPRS